jgi:hypothetical protein
LGDSITFGAGVPESDTFEADLARRIDRDDRPADVLNCGVSGYNLVQSLRRYDLDLAALKPDVIVVGLFVDDFTAPYRMHDRSLAARFRTRSAAWRAFELGAAWMLDQRLRDLPPWAEDDAAYERVARERFRAWAGARRAEGIRVVAIIHPPLMDLQVAPGLKAHPELAQAAMEAGVPFHSMEDSYRDVVGTDLYKLSIHPETQDPHPARQGHALVGQAIEGLIDGS